MAVNSAANVSANSARPLAATANHTKSPSTKPAMKLAGPPAPRANPLATTVATLGPGEAVAMR